MAQTNSRVLAALREKEGITNRGIGKRRDRLTRLVPMPTDIASYVVAHRAGINIARYLPEEIVARVGEYEQRLHQKEASSGASPAPRTPPARRKTRTTQPVEFPNFRVPAGALSAKQLKNAEQMARSVYPLLYAVENSMREFVAGHLAATYGNEWWDRPKLVSKPIRDVVKRNQRARGRDRWVVRSSAHPIYLTELGHVSDIITSEEGWKVFKKLLPRQSWVTEMVKAFEQPRNVVAHMNPLQPADTRGLETRAGEWFRQIEGHAPPGHK